MANRRRGNYVGRWRWQVLAVNHFPRQTQVVLPFCWRILLGVWYLEPR